MGSVAPQKWMVGKRSFPFWDGLISGAASLLVSGSVETSYFLPSHSDMSQPPGTCQRTTAATQRSNEASWAATIGFFKPFSASENQPTKTWVFRVYIYRVDSTTQLFGGIPIKQPGFNGKPTKKNRTQKEGLFSRAMLVSREGTLLFHENLIRGRPSPPNAIWSQEIVRLI